MSRLHVRSVAVPALVAVLLASSGGVSRVSLVTALEPLTSRFVPIDPIRVVDTRIGFGSQPADDSTVRVDPLTNEVLETARVERDAVRAVVVNATVTESARAGFLTLWPGGEARPIVSNLNVMGPGQTIANLATVGVGIDGTLSVYSLAGGHFVLDVAGVYVSATTSSAGRFVPLGPTRLLDTRTRATPLAPRGDMSVDTTSVGVPASAAAVVFNLTTTNTVGPGFFTVWPGGARPLASNLNVEASDQTRANQVISSVTAGRFELYSYGGGDVIVDVTGYFTGPDVPAAREGLFVPGRPFRILDTREWPHGILRGGWSATLDPVAWGLAEPGAGAVAANVTMVEPVEPGFVTAYPGPAAPPTSTVNAMYAGQVVANHAIIGLAANDSFIVQPLHDTHVVIDVFGSFVSPNSPSSLPPGTVTPLVNDAEHSVHVIYAIPTGARPAPGRIDGIVSVVDQVRHWFAGEMRGSQPSFVRTDDEVAVTVVDLSVSAADLTAATNYAAELDAAVRAELPSDLADRALLVFLEGAGDPRACGVTIRRRSDDITAGGTSMIPMDTCRIYPLAGVAFPGGGTYLVAHEVTHLLGAVPDCAPHHSGGHISDDPRDILYVGPSPRDWENLMLDPGQDDYYGHGRADCWDIADSDLIAHP